MVVREVAFCGIYTACAASLAAQHSGVASPFTMMMTSAHSCDRIASAWSDLLIAVACGRHVVGVCKGPRPDQTVGSPRRKTRTWECEDSEKWASKVETP